MKQNKIAITGGIGSGKSTVAKLIRERGYAVYSCDETYARLLSDENLLSEICAAFGNVLNGQGKLDRKRLSAIIFSDRKKLRKLNEITHPRIFRAMFDEAERDGGKICFFEVPLLFDGGYEKLFDDVIVVLRDEKKRAESIRARDGLTENQINERIKSQFNYDICDFAKYYVIHNNRTLDELEASVDGILGKIVK